MADVDVMPGRPLLRAHTLALSSNFIGISCQRAAVTRSAGHSGWRM